MRYLFLFIIMIPAAEIGLLMFSGNMIGILPTFLLIILTGIVGAYLAKQQGLETIRKAQEEMRYGNMPGDAILDGICVLIGGTLLLTPGFVTDIAGLLLLIPFTRVYFKKLIGKALMKWFNNGRITIIR